jgi:hypothetical protein
VPEGELPLIQLVQQAWRQGPAFARETPRLSPRHPDHAAYRRLTALDQTVFIRRLIPKAVGRFREVVEGESREGA